MAHKQTIADWFREHPQALTFLNGLRPDTGYRRCVSLLQEKCGYPFRDHTALMDFCGASAPAASAARGPAKFERTGADLRRLEGARDFIVTSAVNNCEVNSAFLAALERWKGERGGEIVVSPVRYQNPTNRGEDARAREEEKWAPEIEPYLLDTAIHPHPFLSIMPSLVSATTNNVLPPRFDAMTKARSAVFGHPQLCMKTVATPQEKLPKILYTTGAVTEPSYSDCGAGYLADHHHSLGAVIAEVRDDCFHLREVIWDGESFIDVDRQYTEGAIKDAPPAMGLILGDVHVGHEDPLVEKGVFGHGGLYDTLDPRYLVLHDLADNLSTNPHELRNELTRAARARDGALNVEAELNRVGAWLGDLPRAAEVVVVSSNHDDFLLRWLQRGERDVLPENKKFYHALSYAMLEAEEQNGKFPPVLEAALGCVGHNFDGATRFLELDESFMLGGTELGGHGHLGINGARGSIRSDARLGVKSIGGHVHSPEIFQGARRAGIYGKVYHGYNHGPSGWLQTQIGMLANAKAQMFHVIKGRWRG